MEQKIWLSLAKMSGNEQKYIQDAFDTNWVVPLGPNVNGFEADLQHFLGNDSKHIVALSAGTAAIHLALVILDVQRGDEVVCQSFTFAASANPITYLGATPVFVDSEDQTWNMSPKYLEMAIEDRITQTGKKPKAIIVVHLYGMPAEMDAIMDISNKYNIPVIEDAAEALGSEYKGVKCGTIGQYGILSFNGNKIITTSGGGALVCPSKESASRIMFYATQARDNAPHYEHTHIGYNYRMSNICAGIGRGQMTVLNEFVARRRAIHQIYKKELSNIKGLTVFENDLNGYNSNYWLTTILVDPALTGGVTREDIRLACDAANIETRPLWKPMHLQPVFAKAPFYGDGTSEKLFNDGLCLPSGTSLTDKQIEYVISIIKSKL